MPRSKLGKLLRQLASLPLEWREIVFATLAFVCKTSFRGVVYWKGETAENVNKLIASSWDFKEGLRSVDARLYAE